MRAAFVRLAERNAGFTSGRQVTPEWWADQQMARIDGYAQGVFPRAHFEIRMKPWMEGRLWDLDKKIINACVEHCRGG